MEANAPVDTEKKTDIEQPEMSTPSTADWKRVSMFLPPKFLQELDNAYESDFEQTGANKSYKRKYRGQVFVNQAKMMYETPNQVEATLAEERESLIESFESEKVVIVSELDEAKIKIANLEIELEEERRRSKAWMWGALGLGTLGLFIVIILLRRFKRILQSIS